MEQKKKSKNIVKGGGRAVVFSILIHAVLFLLATSLVVFTVVRKEEQQFDPPQVTDRPKMKLKKPKVQVKKSSRPKSPARILTKSRQAVMPVIQLPEMGGMGDGLGDVVAAGFDIMPNLEDLTVFGSGRTIGNDLAGTFYDLKRDRNGRPVPYSREEFAEVMRKFLRNGFDSAVFSKYYRSPKKLYATSIMVPPMLSSRGPMAYGEDETAGCLFLLHYTGALVYPEDITFRFRGGSGDVLFVGVDEEIVLNAAWWNYETLYCAWYRGSGGEHRKHMMGFQQAAVGEWITLKAGEPRKIDVIIGEDPGGGFSAQLAVEVKDVEYEHNSFGAPILPAFKTEELNRDQLDAIYYYLVEGEVCLTNGPIFSDYKIEKRTNAPVVIESIPEPDAVTEHDDTQIRTWTTLSGKTFMATYVVSIGDKAVLQNDQGKQVKIALVELDEEDRQYIELNSPPDFNINFARQTSTRPALDPGPYIVWIPPTLIDYVFTAKVKQTSAGSYNHELEVEYFAVGEEVAGDNYILLDRQKDVFTPTQQNKRAHEFSGPPVLCYSYLDYYRDLRGSKYGGYLITVTDSRGVLVAHRTSNKWLFENLENLKQVPVGRHFNKSCIRVFPTGPKRKY